VRDERRETEGDIEAGVERERYFARAIAENRLKQTVSSRSCCPTCYGGPQHVYLCRVQGGVTNQPTTTVRTRAEEHSRVARHAKRRSRGRRTRRTRGRRENNSASAPPQPPPPLPLWPWRPPRAAKHGRPVAPSWALGAPL